MKKVTVIIHGWSDSSKSFEKIKNFLLEKKLGSIETILYADYESREDHLTMEDIADGLQGQFIQRGLIDKKGRPLCEMSVIVHSTGGLVVRHWIARYYGSTGRIHECPVKKIVMLAPANFGSPLAHRGKSFFPSLVKGRWKAGDFLETGRQILSALELGSPYQWELAHYDLICKAPYFSGSKIQTTVMVGIEGYGGVAKVVNKPGTDGTVVIAGTSLNSAKLLLDFTCEEDIKEDSAPYAWEIEKPKGDLAFAVLESLDHSRIVGQAGQAETRVSSLLIEALEIESVSEFRDFQKKLAAITDKTYETSREPRYQQFLVHAQDDQGRDIEDFTLDFFVWKSKRNLPGDVVKKETLGAEELQYSQKAGDILTSQFHTHTVNPSYRSFLVNLGEIKSVLEEAKNAMGADVALSMRVFAAPVDPNIRYNTDAAQNIVLFSTAQDRSGMPSFFYENTTTLLELRIDRSNDYVTVSQSPRKH